MRFAQILIFVPMVASAASLSFGPRIRYDVGVFPSGSTATLADLNSDSRPDMIVVPSADDTGFSILLNQGDGTFFPPQHYTIPDFPARFTTSDFNEDGSVDILIGNEDYAETGTNTTIYLGDGAGAFTNRTDFALDSSRYISLFGSGDFNGDGHRDLVVRIAGIWSGVKFGNGNGTFGPTITNQTAVFPMAKDFNADGRDDLIARSPFLGMGVLLSRGDNTFARPKFFPFRKVNSYTFDARVARYVTASLLIEDVNGDGIQDLISLDADALKEFGNVNLASVRLGRKHGRFAPPKRYFRWIIGSLSVGDLDGDGNQDLIGGQSPEDFVLVAPGTGKGRFAQPFVVPLGVDTDQIITRDLNGDNRVDLVVYSRGGGLISVLLNTTETTNAPSINTRLSL